MHDFYMYMYAGYNKLNPWNFSMLLEVEHKFAVDMQNKNTVKLVQKLQVVSL